MKRLFKRVILWDTEGSLFPSRRRQRFISSRTPMLDSAFIAGACVPAELSRMVLTVRQAMGRMCKVPPELIRPEDTPRQLIRMIFLWDDVEFLMHLEGLLGIELQVELPTFTGKRCFWMGEDGAMNFGEWAQRVAENLQNKGVQPTP